MTDKEKLIQLIAMASKSPEFNRGHHSMINGVKVYQDSSDDSFFEITLDNISVGIHINDMVVSLPARIENYSGWDFQTFFSSVYKLLEENRKTIVVSGVKYKKVENEVDEIPF